MIKISNKQAKGFTLIELLVVIAIIGILSSIVIASLNSARTKGSVAAVKGGLAQVRAQAENYYDTNGTYGASVSATVSTTSIMTNAAGDRWAISTQLKNGKYYCIANDGTNKEATSTAASSTGSCT
jgi:prepilin-type N-terminal cleavage/methylation domain-containing protein